MIRISAALFAIFLFCLPAVSATVNILALGDSLTAGYGLDPKDAFPVKLEAALKANGHDVKVVNAGVSGDTAAAGLARLDWSLTGDISAVIVELGANDALRGLDPKQAEAALDQILTRIGAKGLPVLVAGMQAPRNMGKDYVAAFDPIFQRLAEKHKTLLYPFFLDGVAADPKLNQPDGLHPTAEGIDMIVARILPRVEELVGQASAK
ncbi:MAG: arylesterase [Rhizobiales bacterium]|nr:arylesterase [Hyphomicrobiales bacterium]